jgi:hypothetical protein
MLTPDQERRLTINVQAVKTSPGWRVIHQWFVGEASDDKPDFASMKALVMKNVSELLDEEIKMAKRIYGKS